MIGVVGQQRDEVDALGRLPGPAAAADVQRVAQGLGLVPAGTEHQLQVAIQFRYGDFDVGQDQRLAQLLVLGFQERAPAQVVAMDDVHGTEEIGLSPHHLLLAQCGTHPAPDIEAGVPLAHLVAFDVVHPVVARRGRAVDGVAGGDRVVDVVQIAGFVLAVQAIHGAELRPLDVGPPLQAQGAAQHGNLALAIQAPAAVGLCLRVILQVDGDVFTQVAGQHQILPAGRGVGQAGLSGATGQHRHQAGHLDFLVHSSPPPVKFANG